MRRLFLLVSLCVTCLLLSACAVKHNYAYTPPEAASDRVCVARCSSGKSQCEKICKLKYEDCTKRGGVFCKQTCPCVISFNTCYTACGGQVSSFL